MVVMIFVLVTSCRNSNRGYFPRSAADSYYEPIGYEEMIMEHEVEQTKSGITIRARLGNYKDKIELHLAIITMQNDLTLDDLDISLKDRNGNDIRILKAYGLSATTTISNNYRTRIEFKKNTIETPLVLQIVLKGKDFSFKFK